MRRELGQLSLADGLVEGGAGRNRQLERIAALVPVREFTDDKCLIFATRMGTVKKTRLSEFSRPRAAAVTASSGS